MTRLWMMHLPFIWLFDTGTAAYPEGFWKYDNGRIWHMQEVPAFICLEPWEKVQISQE